MHQITDYHRLINRLLKIVKPLSLQMVLAIFFGSVGHILASLIPALGMYYLGASFLGWSLNFQTISCLLVLMAVVRAVFKYLEQLFNHYVAFKILAILRDLVFKKLRTLAPAKMESKDKGDLVTMLTSDIELLEVFYAHTISPVCIALIHTTCFFIILSRYHPAYAFLLLGAHLLVGVLVPVVTEKSGRQIGDQQRQDLAGLNALIMDSFQGMKELINYDYAPQRFQEIQAATDQLNHTNQDLAKESGKNFSLSACLILATSLIFCLVAAYLYQAGMVNLVGLLFPIGLFISSFGPTSALSSLANNLLLTLACGQRLFALLDEAPQVEEVTDGLEVDYQDLSLEGLTFSYDDSNLIQDFNLQISKQESVGLSGKSGCGKSTLIQLMMRFYDPDQGRVKMNGQDIRDLSTDNLRQNIAYLAQHTHLFKGTIRDNLLLAKADATEEELIAACQKASIYELIQNLDQGLDTLVVSQENHLSTGQIQRLALARMFLKDSPLYLLDEPTANIDALNEGMILKALYQEKAQKTLILSSHRPSTLRICDRIIRMERGIDS